VVGGWLREILAIFLLGDFRRIRNFVEHRDLPKLDALENFSLDEVRAGKIFRVGGQFGRRNLQGFVVGKSLLDASFRRKDQGIVQRFLRSKKSRRVCPRAFFVLVVR